MKTSVLLDFILPAVIGLAMFGALTWVAHSYILHPNIQTGYGTVWAGSTAAVNATVQVQAISLTQPEDGSIDYGVLATSATQNTITLGDTQTATNDGNISEAFNLQGVNTANWNLSTTAIGADIYMHNFSVDGSTYATLDVDVKTGRSGIGINTSATFDFRIDTPNSDSSNGATQEPNITFQAVSG